MGWLRTLMAETEPPLPSFGRLAARCIGHPEWPDDVRSRERSLSALFSKLDRNLELEWLDERPAVQRVLSSVLGCSLGDVQRPVTQVLGRREQRQQLWPLPGAPAARPLALAHEQLPPGLPPEVTQPSGWDRAFWPTVEQDAELVGRWLSARRLALCVSGDESVDPLHEHDLPLFVLAAEVSAPGLVEGLSTRRCLIAGPPATACPHDFTLVRPLPPERWIDELVRWFGERLPSGGASAAVASRRLREAAELGLLDSLETALGLAAACDDLGADAASDSLADLARRFLRSRLARSDVAEQMGARWLDEHAFRAMVGMVRGALCEHERRWDAERTKEHWQHLVPEPYQRGVDAEWARTSLAHAAGLTAHQLEAALRRSPPGAFRLVRAFETAGLLGGVERLRLEPRWLSLVARDAAAGGVLDASPAEWGALLLQATESESLRRRLAAELQRDGDAVLAALSPGDGNDEAARVMALETTFELTGAALLAGAQFDPSSLGALWEAQAAVWLTLDAERVVPRLVASTRSAARLGAWLLSAWAISETLESASGMPMVVPWASPAELPVVALDAVLAHLEQAAGDGAPTTVARCAGYRLIVRLFADRRHLPSHRISRVPRALSATCWDDVRHLHDVPAAGDVLRGVLEDEFPHFAAHAFGLWFEAGADSGMHCLNPAASTARHLWPHLPLPLAATLVRHGHPFIHDIPCEVLSREVFGLLLELPSWPDAVFEHLPHALLGNAVEILSRRRDHGGLGRLWRGFRDSLLHELTLWIEAKQWALLGPLLYSMPVTEAPQVLPLVATRLEAFGVVDPLPLVARPWLQALAAEPHPTRLQAYSLLAQIEEGLAAMHR